MIHYDHYDHDPKQQISSGKRSVGKTTAEAMMPEILIDLAGASARDYDGRWRRTQEMEEKQLEEFCIQLENCDFTSS